MAIQNQTYIMLQANGQRAKYAQIAKFEDDVLVFFDIWPLNDDVENLEFAAPPAAIGSLYKARILQIDRKTNLCFLNLGKFDAVMRVKPKQNYTEGQYILAEIISEAHGDKKPRVRFAGEAKQAGETTPIENTPPKNIAGLFRAAPNLAQFCIKLTQLDGSKITCDDFGFAAALKNQALADNAEIDLVPVEFGKNSAQCLFELCGFADEIETLQNAQIGLLNGGNIVIEQSSAMTVIDVNSGLYKGDNHIKMVEDINHLAADKIFSQLALRQIGGLVVIDFLKYERKTQKLRFTEYLTNLATKYNVEMGSYTSFGLLELKIKRMGKNLNQKLADIT